MSYDVWGKLAIWGLTCFIGGCTIYLSRKLSTQKPSKNGGNKIYKSNRVLQNPKKPSDSVLF